eukprot:10152751-Heterocapsa_arctica.AAC.1
MLPDQGSPASCSASRSRSPLVRPDLKPGVEEALHAVRAARDAFVAALEVLSLLEPHDLPCHQRRLLSELDLLAALELPLLRQ